MKRSLLAQGLLDCSLNMDLLLILALIKARVLHLTLIESNSGILLLFSVSIVNILESVSCIMSYLLKIDLRGNVSR